MPLCGPPCAPNAMKINASFWDTSALLLLCVRQAESPTYQRWWQRSDRIVVWWGTTVEMRSALSRLARGREITPQGLQFALTRMEAMRPQWRAIAPSEKLRDRAEGLPDAYGVKALDAFQLAAALIWCQEKPKGRLFLCDDAQLSAAASQAGFTVK